jgi:CRISPR-associated protein Csm3
MKNGGYEGNEKRGDNFNIYYRPKKELDGGCIVCEFGVNCVTEFRMKGVDEETVTVDGMPVIPGSTIKGALRRKFYYNPEIKGNGENVWIEGCKEPVIRWNGDKIDCIFGSPKMRSRILVSDAFSDTGTNVPDGKKVDEISEGSVLKCWIVFDNMEKRDIKTILSVLNRGLQITGNTSAKRNPTGKPERNKVLFDCAKAWKFCVDCEGFNYDINEEFK